MTGLTEREVEERLRTGLTRRAEHAPSGAAVLVALARTRPVRRPAALWLAVVAAVALVAVGVPVGFRLLDDHGRTPATSAPVARLTIRPGWLPAGFTERYREASPDGAIQTRRWERGPVDSPSMPTVVLSQQSMALPDTVHYLGPGDPTTVAGHVAVVSGTGTSAMVRWKPTPDLMLQVTVTNVPDARNVAIRVADSTEPDTRATVVPGMAFGWLPSGVVADTYAVFGVPPGAGASMITASTTGSRSRYDVFVVRSSTRMNQQEGSTVIVRGRVGQYVAVGAPGSKLVLRLADGTWLTVFSEPLSGQPQLTKAALVGIVDGLTFGPAPDYSWLDR